MSKHVRMAGLALGGAALCAIASVSYASTVLSVSPGAETVGAGSTFTVEVDVAGVSDLYGYQFDLSFNPKVVEAISSSEGAFLPTAGSTFFLPGTNDNVNGVVSATADTLISAVPGATGSGALAFFTFAAIGAGTSTLSIGNAQLLDSNLNAISSQSVNGSITVGSPVPLPASAWLLLSGMFGLGALARKKRGNLSALATA